MTANVMKFLDWDCGQWAYVKMRHREYVGEDLPETFKGIVDLQTWYLCRNMLTPPLSRQLLGVNYKPSEADVIWAARAMCKAIEAMAAGSAPFPRPLQEAFE